MKNQIFEMITLNNSIKWTGSTTKISNRFLGIFILINIICHTPMYKTFGQEDSLFHQVKIQADNDAFRIKTATDRFYSFGIGITYHLAVKKTGKSGPSLANKIFKGEEKILFTNQLFIKGFTPEYQESISGEPSRPFAGISTIESFLTVSNSKRIWKMGTHLGVRGKISGAEWIQDTFHGWISSPIFEGWRHQLPNKFLYGIQGSYGKPVPLGRKIELIFQTNASLGNYQIFLEEWVGIRFGLFNNAVHSGYFNNFIGRHRKSPGEIFAAINFIGRATVTDATLDYDRGNNLSTASLDKSNLILGYQASIQGQWNRFGVRLAHTQTSTESNLSEKHSFGSISISYSFR